MKPTALHSYLLWRSSVAPDERKLAAYRFTASASLIPAVLVGLFVFGWYAGLVLAVALLSAFLADLAAHKFNGRWILYNPVGTRDGTWLLTGLLIGLLMPPQAPLWVPMAGSVLAILVGKHGLSVDGMPLLQPAVLALLVLHLLPFANMHPRDAAGQSQWPVLARGFGSPAEGERPIGQAVRAFLGGNINTAISKKEYDEQLFQFKQPEYAPGRRAEAYYGPRPLDLAAAHPGESIADLSGPYRYDAWQLILGYTPGPIGGTSALALALGILLLIFTGSATWIMPLFALATLFAGMCLLDPPNAWIHLFSGYTLLGFVYLAAAPLTAPRSKRGKILAGICVGLLELLLRRFTPLAEATFISAVFVQGLSFVFDQYLAPPKEAPPAPRPGVGYAPLG